MVAVTRSLVLLGVIGLVVGAGCGESSSSDDGPAGGKTPGATGGAGGGTGGKSGGAGGSSAAAGRGGNANGGWDATCGGVTPNGRCDGDVYEWCDYFTRSLKSIDCAGLGMTCHADATQPPETDVNGCVGDPCSADDELCDGRLKYECISGAIHVVDCAQSGGDEAVCEVTSDSGARCRLREPCDTPNTLRCVDRLVVICNEDGYQYFQDCARCNPQGTCVGGAGQASCMPSFLDCSE